MAAVPARGIDSEAAAQGEPSAAWKAANLKPSGGKVMGVPVGEIMRESKRTGWKNILALSVLVAVCGWVYTLIRNGPPSVTIKPAAAAPEPDTDRLLRFEKKLDEALWVVTQLKADLAADRLERKALEERVRGLEIKVGK